MTLKTADGFAWNPLKRFPRNHSCFCGSGKKAKSCCMPRLTQKVFEKDAKTILSVWDELVEGRHTLEFNIGKRPPVT